MLFGDGPVRKKAGLFFSLPRNEIICNHAKDIPLFFRRIEKTLAQGYYLAGYFTYEFGYAREKAGAPPVCPVRPLAWMGVFDSPFNIKPDGLRDLFKPDTGAAAWPDYWLRPPVPSQLPSEYQKKIKRIQKYIAAGDTYQVNYTFPLVTQVHGNAGTLFAGMLSQQPVGYAAFLRGGGRTMLSLSPELFFERQGDRLTTRPMKGTAARPRDSQTDSDVRRSLSSSPKNRAENLMIVDLLRNDLGRLCLPGSIRVSRLFQIETYRTLYHMTSTIIGRLRQRVDWQTIFQSLFPCGSVTGAPKIRTMQIISELENSCRGVYTGALGYITPHCQAVFNVPIRTLEINENTRQAVFGIGSGIVSDSQPAAEWKESLAKARFFMGLARDYQLIETMRWDPVAGYRDLNPHMQRLKKSVRVFNLPCKINEITGQLLALARNFKTKSKAYRVRLLLHADGRVKFETLPLDGRPGDSLPTIKISRCKVHSRNLFLYHKTTNREMYNREYQKARQQGLADVLFTNEYGAVTEGAITNLFIRKGEVWLTPPISDGLLPGVERIRQLRSKKRRIVEKRIYRRDLIAADEIYLANSVRGFFQVRLKS